MVYLLLETLIIESEVLPHGIPASQALRFKSRLLRSN